MFRKNIAKLATRLKSKGRYSHLKVMKELEYKAMKECLTFQKERLFKIIKHAVENVPYYQMQFQKNKIKFSIETIFEDIKEFPILTKSLLRDRFIDLKSNNFKGRFCRNTSGGSTGEPAVFLQDISYKEANKASKIFFNEWAGRKEGEKMIKLWGSEKEIIEGSQGLNGWIEENILNVKLLNSFKVSKKKMKDYIQTINFYKPSIIEAYVQSIYELAKLVKKEEIKIFSPKGIIVSAGTLYPEMKSLIEEVFGCKVFNQYGSREVGMIAFSCEKQEGLHLDMLNNFVEILDEEMKPCLPGSIGKVYITTLNNFVMPLIRYEIGDVAIPAKNQICSCGRGLTLIKSVRGRDVNLFRTEKGELIDGEYFTHLFYMKGWVRKFQVIQKRLDLIEINMELSFEKVKNKKDIEQIEKDIRFVLGENVFIKWNFLDYIEPTKSGKYLYTISELK